MELFLQIWELSFEKYIRKVEPEYPFLI